MMRIKNLNSIKINSSKPNYQNRNDLGKTSSKCDLKQLICFIGFIISLILDLYVIQWSSPIQDILIWYIRLVLAIPIIIIALRTANKSLKIVYQEFRNPPHVIKNGPFRYSRHPMYLSALLLYLSLEIVFFSIIGFIYLMGVFLLYSYFARYEEKYLLLEFEEEYKDFINRVSRWIGFPKKGKQEQN